MLNTDLTSSSSQPLAAWHVARSTPCSQANTDVAASFKYLAHGADISNMFPQLATKISKETEISAFRVIAYCFQLLILMVSLYTNMLE